jgi:hypothetical protein
LAQVSLKLHVKLQLSNVYVVQGCVGKIVDSMKAGGGTNIGAGLTAGQNELDSKGDSTHPQALILLSDGFRKIGNDLFV